MDLGLRSEKTDFLYNGFNVLFLSALYNNCKILYCRHLWLAHVIGQRENDNQYYNHFLI